MKKITIQEVISLAAPLIKQENFDDDSISIFMGSCWIDELHRSAVETLIMHFHSLRNKHGSIPWMDYEIWAQIAKLSSWAYEIDFYDLSVVFRDFYYKTRWDEKDSYKWEFQNSRIDPQWRQYIFQAAENARWEEVSMLVAFFGNRWEFKFWKKENPSTKYDKYSYFYKNVQ